MLIALRAAVLASAVALALAGCADPDGPLAEPPADEEPTPAATPSPAPHDGAADRTPRPANDAVASLEVERVGGDGAEHRWQLTCDGDGAALSGETPADVDADAACATVAEEAATLVEPPDEEQLCTQIYGGDDEAEVTGTVLADGDEHAVDRTFDLRDGCAIDAWERLEAVLGAPADSG